MADTEQEEQSQPGASRLGAETTDPSGSPRASHLVRCWACLPRLEFVILAVGLLCNLYGKYHVLHRGNPDSVLASVLVVSLSDFAFFGGVAVLIALAHRYGSWPVTSRLAILVAALAASYSVANMAWLIATGVQIHTGVLANLVRDPKEFGPIVTNRLVKTPRFSIPLLTVSTLFALVILWRLVRPKRVQREYYRPGILIPVAFLIVGGSVGFTHWSGTSGSVDPQRAALSYSSQWLAVTSLPGVGRPSAGEEHIGTRQVLRAGERPIIPPPGGSPRPHVIMIVLESTGYWATSFGDQPPDQTPTLTELAQRGILFENTRTILTHTTHAEFAMLTGTSPARDGGYVEAVPVDPPYESLATILRGWGYRTRFTEMAKGTFECRPSLAANLGFESFFAREDLQDPAAHLGYLAGDDFRMIEPAFAWFDRQSDPCFIMFTTSVTHHPYEVPRRYGSTPEDPQDAFLLAVRCTDDFVKAVVGELEKRDLLADTVLCVIADHGQGFGKHDVMQHNQNPYEEAIRVPWIITWPGRIEGGRIVEGLCSALDVAPTILDLLGFDISGSGFEGLSALSTIPADREIRFAGWDAVDPAGFVRKDRKVVYYPSLNRVYAYDLSRDPEETRPGSVSADETERIRQALDDWRLRSRITFDARRYRERTVFGHWRILSQGNTPWCYYVPLKSTAVR